MSLYTRLKMTSKQNHEIGFNEMWRELMMAMLYYNIYTEITEDKRLSFSSEVRLRVLDQKFVGSVNVFADINENDTTKTEKHEIFFEYGNGRGKQFDSSNNVEYLELYIPINGNADRILLNIAERYYCTYKVEFKHSCLCDYQSLTTLDDIEDVRSEITF